MNLHQLFLTNNDCYKAGATIIPKGIMAHSTGANNPNLKRYVNPDDGLLGNNPNGNDWNRPGLSVCVHSFIGLLEDGTVATYQTLPWNYRGWHCGSGPNGSGNNTHISFELCEDDLTDSGYFNAVYQEAAELSAYLCKMYNFNPLADGVLISHSEGYTRGIASNHSDVMNWFPKFGKTMDDFRNDVALLLNNGGSGVPFTVRISISNLIIRTGPGTNYARTGKYTGVGTFTIVEVQSGQGSASGWGRLKSGAGWISLDYTTRV